VITPMTIPAEAQARATPMALGAHAGRLFDSAGDDAGHQAHEGGIKRREPDRKKYDDRKQGNEEVPPLLQDIHELGQLVAAQTAQVAALGLEVHFHEHAEEIETGRDGRRLGDVEVGHVEELRHDEGRSPHDGRHDLAAGRGGGFHRRCELGPVAQALHHGDGKAAGFNGIGDRASGHRSFEGAGDDRHLGRPARGPTGNRVGDVDEELAQPGFFTEGAEQDEEVDEGCRHA
jgi:hypothetical protein